MKIAPSVLAADYLRLGESVKAVEAADMLHLDIMDGHFVPNISFGPDIVRALRPQSPLFFDVHLMLTHPRRYLEAFRQAGADGITVHAECADEVAATLREIREMGLQPGISLKPGTPVESLLPFLPLCGMVLVMTVEPGFGGQRFMAEQTEKLRFLKRAAPGVLLEVDGGINMETAKICRDAGADILVAGTSVFGAPDVSAALRALQAL